MTGTSSAVAEAPLSELGFARDLPKVAFAGGLGAALPPLMARSTGCSSIGFATTAFPAALADLFALGISRPLSEVPLMARVQCSGNRRYDRPAGISSIASES